VHHAVNDPYLDRNYGGVLIVWDRLFGSFAEEGDKCVYGTRSPLNSWDPLWSNFEVYAGLAKDSWHARNWFDKVRVWFKPPGWRPVDVAARFPKPAFQVASMERFHPPMNPQTAWFAAVEFVLMLGGVTVFLWNVDTLPLSRSLVWLAALVATLWAIGGVMQGRLSPLMAVLVQSAAIATASGADGMIELHRVFKPLVMLLAIAMVASRGPVPLDKFRGLLIAALAFSLAGDCFLMFPGYFIPGLVSFLIAHLGYIALFRHDAPWFANRKALACTLGAAALMYAVLFPGLPPVLKVAVACYAVVIACMAAQAVGRASFLRDRGALHVAMGAVIFMLSDSILAINKFAIPLPAAQFFILATYYAAQVLIVANARPGAAVYSEKSSPALLGGITPR
jgi:alkylglycerol monooxygenase